ncbi:shikimate kinase [Corynebacterium flavescens]|uniref:shikimate kinase n=1 Tax=Corynebacterium flavescens TaxID=28028 RepID=UPI003FD2B029
MTTPVAVTGNPRPRIVLVGPPGAGKSTIGLRLAHALNCELVDSDDLVAAEYGKSCGEVFAELGEPKFREVEARIVAQALESKGVVSLGGGAVLSEATRELLDRHTVIYLEITAEEGASRTAGDNSRPVLQSADPIGHYRTLLEARHPLYTEVADFKIRTGSRSPQQVVGEVLSFMETL